MARQQIAIGDFVATLRSFEAQPITRDRVLEFCQEAALDAASLDAYLHFRPDVYTRN
jgi:hypothetical protein